MMPEFNNEFLPDEEPTSLLKEESTNLIIDPLNDETITESIIGKKRSAVHLDTTFSEKKLKLNSDDNADNTLQRSASLSDLTRTNSIGPDDEWFKNKSRNLVEETHTSLFSRNDYSVIGVYSRESSRNFSKNFSKLNNKRLRLTGSSNNLKEKYPDKANNRLGKVKIKKINGGLNEQFQGLFDEKSAPHVLVIIEGPEAKEDDMLSLNSKIVVDSKEKLVNLNYTKKDFYEGKNSIGATDNKQSFGIFVRNDMQSVYKFQLVDVKRGEDNIPCVAIDYETVDGTKYRSLAVHIPNDFAVSDENAQVTHKAFEDYAAITKSADEIIVTSYFGDTNYTNRYKGYNSAPTIGGIMDNNQGLSMSSSSNKEEYTNFMQSIPLGEEQNDFAVLQPSLLNLVLLPQKKKSKRGSSKHDP